MFVRYDAAAVEASQNFVPAFEDGSYPARATGVAIEPTRGGEAIVVTFDVWAAADRAAAKRQVKCHFCLCHPKVAGMFHARLRDFGLATGAWNAAQGGTDVAQTVGRFCTVEMTKVEGRNQKGEPTWFNRINGFAPYVASAPSGPAAASAGLPPQPPQTPQTGTQATAAQYREASQGYGATPPQTPHRAPQGDPGFGYVAGPDAPPPEGGIDEDGIPFATCGYVARRRSGLLASMPKVVW